MNDQPQIPDAASTPIVAGSNSGSSQPSTRERWRYSRNEGTSSGRTPTANEPRLMMSNRFENTAPRSGVTSQLAAGVGSRLRHTATPTTNAIVEAIAGAAAAARVRRPDR